MLFALLRNKLGRNSERAHERSEDLLTSTAFQLLRYLPFSDGLGAVVNRACRICYEADRVWLSGNRFQLPEGVDGCDLRMWHRFPGNREPDIIATFTSGGKPVGSVVIEVKLDSRKSGSDESNDGLEPRISRDQLRGYWQLLNEESASTRVPALGVIYLTADAIEPIKDLASSVKNQPGDWLYWVSWHEVAEVARQNTRSDAARLPAEDLISILRKNGLGGFMGFPKDDSAITIGTAVNKVYEWHLQIREFYNSLDRIFERMGWQVPEKRTPVGEVKGSLSDDPEMWSLFWFLRAYGPQEGSTIVVLCHLSPNVEGDLYSPRCVIAKVRGTLGKVQFSDFPDVGPAIEELGTSLQPKELSAVARQTFLKRAENVIALTIPLSMLETGDDLRRKLIHPILGTNFE